MSKTYKGVTYGVQRKEREGREEMRGEVRKRREKGEISVHRQAMADALEVIHLQEIGTWNR